MRDHHRPKSPEGSAPLPLARPVGVAVDRPSTILPARPHLRNSEIYFDYITNRL
jgi:hypothetical protein